MSETEPSPARVVADADVLIANLLVDGPARAALDHLRQHSWTTLVASDPFLDDAEAVVSSLTGADLVANWREKIDSWAELITHPDGDNPVLAPTYRGGAMCLLTFDDRLSSAQAGAALDGRFLVSVRHPKAFASLFAPEGLYTEVEGGPYPEPDRDLRA